MFAATLSVLVLLVVLRALNRATYRPGRAAMVRELSSILENVSSPNPDELEGSWQGMPVHIALGRYSIDYEITLPYAVISYAAQMKRHGGRELESRMRLLDLRVEGDRVIGQVPRENGLRESVVTVEQRLPVAAEVRALRRHAPGELLDALECATSAYEVDTLLVHLAAHFRFSPEMSEAIEVAAERDPHFNLRVRTRVREWMGMRQVPEQERSLVSDRQA